MCINIDMCLSIDICRLGKQLMIVQWCIIKRKHAKAYKHKKIITQRHKTKAHGGQDALCRNV